MTSIRCGCNVVKLPCGDRSQVIQCVESGSSLPSFPASGNSLTDTRRCEVLTDVINKTVLCYETDEEPNQCSSPGLSQRWLKGLSTFEFRRFCTNLVLQAMFDKVRRFFSPVMSSQWSVLLLLSCCCVDNETVGKYRALFSCY